MEYGLIAYFFSLHFRNKLAKNILFFSPFFFTVYSIYDFLKQDTPRLPFLPLSIEYIVLLLFILYYFFEIMQEVVVEVPIYQKTIFWISLAFIVNFSGNFFLFLFSKNSVQNDANFINQYTIIYSTVTTIKNLLLCITIFVKDNSNKESNKIMFEIDLDSIKTNKN